MGRASDCPPAWAIAVYHISGVAANGRMVRNSSGAGPDAMRSLASAERRVSSKSMVDGFTRLDDSMARDFSSEFSPNTLMQLHFNAFGHHRGPDHVSHAVDGGVAHVHEAVDTGHDTGDFKWHVEGLQEDKRQHQTALRHAAGPL